MVKRTHAVHQRALLVFNEMRAAHALVSAHGGDGSVTLAQFETANPYYTLLDRLYAEDYRLAEIMQAADLVVHAEGPGTTDHAPLVTTVTWLFAGVEKQLRLLTGAALENTAPEAVRKGIELHLAGLAPGSLYAGFSIAQAPAPLLPADGLPLEAARKALRMLPIVARHVTDIDVRAELADELPEPALRDASMMAAWALSPTGKRGVHTLEIDAREDDGSFRRGVLDARDRVVLNETVRRSPLMRAPRTGTLEGEVREIDLDTNRFKLRTADGVVRCAFAFGVAQARKLLGAGARVSGSYETDRDGRPRLMRAEHIEPAPQQMPLAG